MKYLVKTNHRLKFREIQVGQTFMVAAETVYIRVYKHGCEWNCVRLSDGLMTGLHDDALVIPVKPERPITFVLDQKVL